MDPKEKTEEVDVIDMDADSKSAEVLDGAEVEEETDPEPEEEDK